VTRQRAVFLGSKAFGLSVFRALKDAEPKVEWKVIHPRDDKDPRSVESEFRQFCLSVDVPFATLSAKTAQDRILQWRPDFVFVCGWYALIDAAILQSGPQFLGIHNSLLPKYRGGAPLVWALINGDRVVGSSLFALDGGMDDGAIFDQVEITVDPDEHIDSVSQRIEDEWAARLPQIWKKTVAGTLEGRVQDHGAATYCAQRRPEDGQIDWTSDARSIHDFVRAQSAPYPGAFTEGPNGRITINETGIFDAPVFGTPGQIALRGDDGPVIACGENTGLVIASATGPDGCDNLGSLFATLSLRF